jgi:AcrR family transcriptional regulator
MTRPATNTRRRILEAGYALFYRQGFTRVSVDAIAERAGLTKRSLYYHFASKDDLLAAVFEFHHEFALERIRSWGDRLPGDLAGMLEALFSDLSEWAAKPKWAGPGFTRVVMELADLPGHPARAIASRHKAAVEAWLAAELARRNLPAAKERAREVVILLEGTTALMLIHGDRAFATAAASAAHRLVGIKPERAMAPRRRPRTLPAGRSA